MKQFLRQIGLRRRQGGMGVFLLFSVFNALSATAQNAEINPQLTSSGGEIQQGEFGALFSTIGEPLASDSTATSAVDGEATWIGFWQIMPADTAAGVFEEWAPLGNGSTGITVAAPNPFSDEVEIYVRLEKSGDVRLVAYDLLGREVQALVDGQREGGTARVRWSPEGLEAGTYLLKLEIDGTQYPTRTIQYVK